MGCLSPLLHQTLAIAPETAAPGPPPPEKADGGEGMCTQTRDAPLRDDVLENVDTCRLIVGLYFN